MIPRPIILGERLPDMLRDGSPWDSSSARNLAALTGVELERLRAECFWVNRVHPDGVNPLWWGEMLRAALEPAERVLCLGRAGLPRWNLSGLGWIVVPHTSGRCRTYNNKEARVLLARGVAWLLGDPPPTMEVSDGEE